MNNHLMDSFTKLWMQIDLFYCRRVISREGQTQNSLRRIGQDVRWAFWLLKTKKNLTLVIYIYLSLSKFTHYPFTLFNSFHCLSYVREYEYLSLFAMFFLFSEIGQDRFFKIDFLQLEIFICKLQNIRHFLFSFFFPFHIIFLY